MTATVFLWDASLQRGSFGHVSIRTPARYVSWWPVDEAGKGKAKLDALADIVRLERCPAFFCPDLAGDIDGLGSVPHHVYELPGLDEPAMDRKWDELTGTRLAQVPSNAVNDFIHGLFPALRAQNEKVFRGIYPALWDGPTPNYRLHHLNCTHVAHHCLTEGGAGRLIATRAGRARQLEFEWLDVWSEVAQAVMEGFARSHWAWQVKVRPGMLKFFLDLMAPRASYAPGRHGP